MAQAEPGSGTNSWVSIPGEILRFWFGLVLTSRPGSLLLDTTAGGVPARWTRTRTRPGPGSGPGLWFLVPGSNPGPPPGLPHQSDSPAGPLALGSGRVRAWSRCFLLRPDASVLVPVPLRWRRICFFYGLSARLLLLWWREAAAPPGGREEDWLCVWGDAHLQSELLCGILFKLIFIDIMMMTDDVSGDAAAGQAEKSS